MDCFKITIKGETAFFKKPDVNAYCYFTYGHLHKLALLGIFGGIMGYGGYAQQGKEDKFPEFYSKLQNLKIAISPGAKEGWFARKAQTFNNSVGYASQEKGGNLIVTEQWLEDVAWDVYVQVDSEESRNLLNRLEKNEFVFLPYLGKNDHLADIQELEIFQNCASVKAPEKIHSLFPKEGVIFQRDRYAEEENEIRIFKYEESLPLQLHPETNASIVQRMMFTNMNVARCDKSVYQVGDKNLIFF